MLITFLIPVGSEKQVGEMKKIVSNIAALDYPMGKIEVIFVIHNGEGRAERKIPGPPMIKILSVIGGLIGSLNIASSKVLGDIVVFADLNATFDKSDAKRILQAKNAMVLGEKWSAVYRQAYLTFPADLACIRTFLIMRAMWGELPIIGSWGSLSRKEILRGIYDLPDLYLNEKLKLTWHFLKGKA